MSAHLKRTKIVATIPSHATVDFLKKLISAGVNVFRLNTAHMELADAEIIVEEIRKASTEVAILIDTKGPEVRTCSLEEPLAVKIGDKLKVVATPTPKPAFGFAVNYANFIREVKVGESILLDDGDTILNIIEKAGDDHLICEVTNDGLIKNKKTVNVPGATMHMPSLTKRDRDFIMFAIEHDLDFIAHSFVRSRDDVLAVQSILETYNSTIKVIAKIENRQGVNNLDAILDVAYGAMVARGDLGVEIPAEEVPSIQKRIIYKCMCRRKPVITATQMLQSMINNPRATRAEISDIANAVLDGSDAVMLSGETAQGKYPIESVNVMSRVIIETEKASYDLMNRPKEVCSKEVDEALWHLVKSAVNVAQNMNVRAVICNTMTGCIPRVCAAYRGRTPVYAMSFNSFVIRQLQLSYGVYSAYNNYSDEPQEVIRSGLENLLSENKLNLDDRVIIVGNFSGNRRGINYMHVSTPREMLLATGGIKEKI